MFDVPQKFYELCRLCLSPDGVKCSIFEEEGIQRSFAEKILACLSITVSVTIDNCLTFLGTGGEERDSSFVMRLSVCVVSIIAVLSLSHARARTRSHTHLCTLLWVSVYSFLFLFSPHVFLRSRFHSHPWSRQCG